MTELIVHIESGQINNKTALRKAFDNLSDGRFLIRIENVNKRTLPMNAFFHGVLVPEFRKALNSVGYDEVKTDQDAKRVIKAMFLTDAITNKETGEQINFVKDTKDLTTLEMSSLFDDVIKFAAENMSYVIPYPGEVLTINFD